MAIENPEITPEEVARLGSWEVSDLSPDWQAYFEPRKLKGKKAAEAILGLFNLGITRQAFVPVEQLTVTRGFRYEGDGFQFVMWMLGPGQIALEAWPGRQDGEHWVAEGKVLNMRWSQTEGVEILSFRRGLWEDNLAAIVSKQRGSTAH